MYSNLCKGLFAVALTGAAQSAFANVITDWNENAVTFVTPRMAPGAGQRVVAIMQVAMFDAVNSIERRYRPYLVQLPVAPTTSKEAAATAAAGIVLASLIPQVQGQVKGSMSFTNAESQRRFAPEDVATAEELAGRVAAAIARSPSDTIG